MAFQAPVAGQAAVVNQSMERANRKILEQLEEQKKRLRLQHGPAAATAGSNTGSTTTPPAIPAHNAPVPVMDSAQMTGAQKQAMQHAMANSVGYFITQDSSFGNLILPVLPRFDK